MSDDSRKTPPLDPAVLERLRRGIPLHMTASGTLLLDGEPITHPRIEQAIREGLDTTEAGELRMILGSQWCYMTVDDCPLRATAVQATKDCGRTRLLLRLDDGRTEDLDPATLIEDPDRGLRCAVPSRHSPRRLAVRFTNTAQMDLSRLLVEDADGLAFEIDGRRFPVARRP